MEKVEFTANDVRQICEALKSVGPAIRWVGMGKAPLHMHFLPCGLPVFYLVLKALDELADQMDGDTRNVSVEYDENRYIDPGPSSASVHA